MRFQTCSLKRGGNGVVTRHSSSRALNSMSLFFILSCRRFLAVGSIFLRRQAEEHSRVLHNLLSVQTVLQHLDAPTIRLRIALEHFGAQGAAKGHDPVSVGDAREPPTAGDQVFANRALHRRSVHIAGVKLIHKSNGRRAVRPCCIHPILSGLSAVRSGSCHKCGVWC